MQTKKDMSELITFPVSSSYFRQSVVWSDVAKEGDAEWQKGEPTEKGTSASAVTVAGRGVTQRVVIRIPAR